jgi:hypothetical protein
MSHRGKKARKGLGKKSRGGAWRKERQERSVKEGRRRGMEEISEVKEWEINLEEGHGEK